MNNKEIMITLLKESIKSSYLFYTFESRLGVYADFFFSGNADTCLALMGISDKKADKAAKYIYEYECKVSELPFEELKERINELAGELYEKIKTF